MLTWSQNWFCGATSCSEGCSTVLLVLILPALYPITLIENQLARRRLHKEAGSPPSSLPGRRIRDHVDAYIVHPIQRRRIRRHPDRTLPVQDAVFPLEIFEHVMDSCEDRDTLKACSLVCSGWIWRARMRLFAEMDVVASRNKAYDGVQLLRSPFCTIQRHIRGLKIHDNENWRVAEGVLDELLRWKDEMDVQRLHLTLYANLKSQPTTYTSLKPTHLHISCDYQVKNRHISLDYILRFCCAFPQLQSLALAFAGGRGHRGVWSDFQNLWYREELRTSRHLRVVSITLTRNWLHGVNVIWRTLLSSSPPLTSLDLYHRFATEDYPLLLECLRRHGPTLVKLGLFLEYLYRDMAHDRRS